MLHRAPPAPAGRGKLIAGGLGVAALALVLLTVVLGRGTAALGPSLVVEPGVGLGSLRLGESSVADAERLLGKLHDDSVQRTNSQSFGPDGAGPEVRRAVADMAYRGRVTLHFTAEVDPSFDAGSPAHREMFARFRGLDAAPLSGVEVVGTDFATARGLRVGDTLEAMLEKQGPPARVLSGRRGTRYLWAEGLVVEVEGEGQTARVTELSVAPPFDLKGLDRKWRVYEPPAKQ